MSISEVSAAEEWLKSACMTLGLQSNVKIIGVVNKWRWTLEYEQDPAKPDFALSMIDLESTLRRTLGRPIDLRLESESDKNRRKQRNVLTDGQSR